MTETELLNIAKANNTNVIYCPLPARQKGIAFKTNEGNYFIGISEELKGTKEGLQVLKYELGHVMTNSFYNFDTAPEVVQEKKNAAKMYAKKHFKVHNQQGRNLYQSYTKHSPKMYARVRARERMGAEH